ncbi:hypothetical protein [Pseudoduganella sp. OTU4001]|uniref:hypothetical protein n=1 Tax=Pseudoduganella sp. OTU4001 TaxID=3043854 RepID=UPI00313B79B3
MFKEIAIDPAAVAASYLQFNHIIDRFGVPEGRLIAAFPSKWKRLVYEAANTQLKGHLDLKRIEERLRKLPTTAFLARERPGQGCGEDWVRAAIDEHRRLPFEAVITAAMVGEPGFLQPADVSTDHPSFVTNRQWHVKRDAVSMADCCGPLLSSSFHLKLIDPHFDPHARRFKRPFLEFMRRTRAGTTIDIFRGDRIDPAHFIAGIQRMLQDWKLSGTVLRLFLRPQDTMHNRFIMSSAGGVSFQIGLDDDATGDRPEDIVTIMQTDVWSREWGTYAGDDSIMRLNL